LGRDWESTFRSWGQAPSQTERDKCENAERAIRKAIAASAALASRSLRVFAQGSYANRTNVRQDSDVDVCVLCTDVCFTDKLNDLTDADCGLTDHPYTYSQFKNEVGQALTNYFGAAAVTRGNKAFDIHANTYRIDADVVPCFEHRRYSRGYDGRVITTTGTEFRPDAGGTSHQLALSRTTTTVSPRTAAPANASRPWSAS
jgi:predicted nucleotidyltransferase